MTERRGAAYRLHLAVEKYLNDHDGVTKTELARRTGLSRPTIDRLRDGRRPPERATVKAIAKAIELDYDEALILAGYPAPISGDVDVRRVIMADPMLEPAQRLALLEAYEAFEALNQARTQHGGQDSSQAPPRRGAAGGERRRLQDGEERRQVG